MSHQNRDDGDPLHQLTPREREVLELLRLGLTNGEIAARLEITLDGAKYHVSEIIGKLGVRDRHEAASYPERRSGWATALAPISFLWRQAGALVSVKASSVALVASAGLGAAALGGIGLIVFFLAQGGGGPGEEVSRQVAEEPGWLVYFTHPEEPGSEVSFFPEDLLEARGGRVVESDVDLRATRAHAIMLDASSVDEVASEWLAEQYEGGVVLVALNFPGEELKGKGLAYPDSFGRLPDADHAPGGRLAGQPYASILWHSATGSHTGGGFDAWQIHVELDAANLEYFLSRIDEVVRHGTASGS